MATGYILLNQSQFTEADREAIASAIDCLEQVPDGVGLSADPTQLPPLNFLLEQSLPMLEQMRHTHPPIASAIDVLLGYGLAKVLLRARNLLRLEVLGKSKIKVVLGTLQVDGYLEVSLTQPSEPKARVLRETLTVVPDTDEETDHEEH